MLYDDKNKDESLYHAALIYSKSVSVGTGSANKKLKELIEEHGNFENIYNSIFGKESHDKSIKKIKGIEKVVETLNRIEYDFKVLTVKDADFPESLKEEGNTPVIYARGDLNLLNNKHMAVVGTRYIFPNKDEQACKEAKSVMKRLVDAGYTIVSGLAKGCDTIAHKYAVGHGGKTIAVLGTPLDKSYPAENKELQEKIAKDHLLISQYPIGIGSYPSYFISRDKTVASLSEGIVVIKASDNSGTIHTVKEAASQGKKIYVLENNFNKNNVWLNDYKENIKEIKNGA